MWDQIINIHLNELLNTTTKDSRINNRKNKMLNNNYKKKMDNLHFILNNIFTEFCKELTKYKNDYQ